MIPGQSHAKPPMGAGTGGIRGESGGLQNLGSSGTPPIKMAKGGLVVNSRSRKKSVSSKTLRRTTAYNMTKAGSFSAGDYVGYHNTAGGETRSAMAPYSSLMGTGLKAGGVVRGPVKALIGEAGPEVVVPLKKKYMNKTVKQVAQHFARKGARSG